MQKWRIQNLSKSVRSLHLSEQRIMNYIINTISEPFVSQILQRICIFHMFATSKYLSQPFFLCLFFVPERRTNWWLAYWQKYNLTISWQIHLFDYAKPIWLWFVTFDLSLWLVILDLSNSNIHHWLATFDLSLLPRHSWPVTLNLSLLTRDFWLITLDLSVLTSSIDLSLLTFYFWVVTLDLILFTCHSWLFTLDFPLLTCHFWHVTLIDLSLLYMKKSKHPYVSNFFLFFLLHVVDIAYFVAKIKYEVFYEKCPEESNKY